MINKNTEDFYFHLKEYLYNRDYVLKSLIDNGHSVLNEEKGNPYIPNSGQVKGELVAIEKRQKELSEILMKEYNLNEHDLITMKTQDLPKHIWFIQSPLPRKVETQFDAEADRWRHFEYQGAEYKPSLDQARFLAFAFGKYHGTPFNSKELVEEYQLKHEGLDNFIDMSKFFRDSNLLETLIKKVKRLEYYLDIEIH